MSLRRLLSKQGGPSSVRFGYGLGVERFERFQFSVPAVPLHKWFFQYSLDRKGRFRFRFLESGSGGSGSAFRFRKKGSDGSGLRFLSHPAERKNWDLARLCRARVPGFPLAQ